MALLAKVLVASMLVLLGCQLASSASVATVSIDIGSEFIKIGLVKPGVPMDIVLNRESKRKTPNVLAIRKGEREFGSDALHTYVKYPQNAYRFLTELLGQKIDSPIVKRYQRLFPEHKLEEDAGRGTVIFRIDEETTYSVEELVAMILEHVMELASEYAEVPVSSAVITVPPYFTQASRKSLLMAAKLGGVNVIQLLSTPAAVGLNYGVFRRSEFNETEQLFMFVDVGSTATTATVAGFKVVKEKDTKTKNPQLELRGMAYDRSLGGLEFDMRMRDILLEKFLNGAKKPKGDIKQNHRALAKLLTGAQKAKTVLSANVDTIAQVEGLFEEINLKETVTREEYETACADLFERVKAPVLAALKAADVTADQLHQVIIIGGGVRVPKIQTILKDLMGGRELGKNLNGDEAAALGAAYQAAANTKSFRVKKFLVKDINPFPIDVVFEREAEGEDGVKETRTITRTIFPRGNAVPQKKLLKFNFETDFNFRMNYGDLSFLSEEQVKELGALNISTVDMSGVQKAYEDHKDIPNEGVKAHFRIDESGVVSIARAEVVFEKPAEPASILDNIADSIGSLFGKGEGDKKAAVEDAAKAEGDGEDAKKASDEEEEEKPASEEGKDSSDDAKAEDAGKGSSESGSEDAKADADDAKTEGSDSGSDEDEEETEEGEKKAADSEEGEKKPEEEEEAAKAGEGAGDADAEGAGAEKKKAEGDSGKEESTEGAKGADDEKKEEGTPAKDEKKAAKDEKKKPPKPTTIKVPLSLKVKTLDVVDLTEAGEKESKARMADFRKKEITKRETAKAKNNLETFIYAMQDKLSNADVEAASTEEERSVLREQLSAASDWLYEDGMDVGAADYIARADELNSTAKEIMFRVKEHKDRPEAVSRLEQSLKMSFEFVEKVKTMNANLTEGENPWITEAEMESLLTVANETSTWLAEKKAKQAETPLTETPVLKTAAIAQKAAKLDRELLSLIKKPKPKPKPTPKPKAEKVVVNGTETDDGAKAEEGSEKPSTTTEEGKPVESETPEGKTTEETAKGDADEAGDSATAKKTEEAAAKDDEATGKTEETPAKEESKKKAEKKTEKKAEKKTEKKSEKAEKKSEKAEKKADKKEKTEKKTEKTEKKTEKKAEKEESKKGRRSSKSRKDDKEEL